MTSRFPARLHVLMARTKPYAVVLRRGPSRLVCAIGWDLRTNRFTTGQWLRARIYERRADLSPDGRYLVYFALNGRWSSSTGGSWTAVSRAPYLNAIELFAKGDGWHGGGLFTGPRRFWLNDGAGHRALTRSSEVSRDADFRPPAHFGGECPGVYYPRLMRDGWALVEARAGDPVVFEKPLHHRWSLRKRAHAELGAPPGKGCYWDEHELVAPDGRAVEAHPDWEWADVHGNTVLFASRGCLYCARFSRKAGLEPPALLRDFNGMAFEPLAAPY